MLARKALLIFLTNLAGAVLGIASLLAVGRFMNPEAFGMLGYALSLIGVIATLGGLAFDKAHVKRLSEGRDVAACLGTFARIRTWLTAIFVVVAVLTITAWDRFVGFFDTTWPILLVVIGYFALNQWRSYMLSTFAAFRLAASGQVTAIVENLVRAPLIVLAAFLFGFLNGHWIPLATVPDRVASWLDAIGPMTNETGALMLAVAWFAGMAASFGSGTWQMRRHGFQRGAYDVQLARSYARFALPMALFSVAANIAREIDMVMIGFFWSSTEVGYYFAAFRLTTIVMIIPTAVRTLFFPLISELAGQRAHEAVRQAAFTTQRAMSLVMVLVTMLIVAFPAETLHIFMSDRFIPASPILQLMALNAMLLSFRLVAFNVVSGFDRPMITARVGLISVAVNIAMNFILIPDSLFGVPMFGLRGTGAALATVLSQVVANVLITREARRILGQVHFGFSNVKHIATALTVWGFLHLLTDTPVLGGVDRVWELAWAGVLGTSLYLGILVLLGEVTRKDAHLLLDVMNPSEMASYIRDEVSGKR